MRADRLLELLLLLQMRGRMTAAELAKRLEVSERTVYRDLSALGSAGVPVFAERGPGGGCGLLAGYRTNLTGLKEDEAQTLFLAGAPLLANDLGMRSALDAAALKLLAALPDALRERVERARQRMHIDPVGWSRYDEPIPHLALAQEATLRDRRLQMRYMKGNGEVVERLVDPLGLVAKSTIWYLVAAVNGELRVFRISRIQAATLTGEPCVRPEGFDLASYWSAWSAEFSASLPKYEVTLRVRAEAIPQLSQVWGMWIEKLIEQAAPDAEGAILLTLAFESLEHARGRMLSLGNLVEALAPDELRASLAEHVAGLAALYTPARPLAEGTLRYPARPYDVHEA